MAHDVTFIPADGTGPELTAAARRVLDATGVDFNWDRHEAGIDEYGRYGNPFPAATLESLKATGIGIKGLDHLHESAAARVLENAIAAGIRKGDKVTYDLKPSRTDPTAVGTSQFADAVIEEMNA